MMRALAILACLALAGCGTIQSLTAPDLTVYAPKVNDQKQYDADKEYCRLAALGYSKQFDLFGTLNDAAQGAAGNISSIPINPIAPAYGAAGNAGADVLKSIGVLNADQRRVYIKCLDKLTERDNSALVLEPN
jgi:uncharacterized protein YceK